MAQAANRSFHWTLVILLSVGSSAVSAQKLYKWTDSEGRTYYSDRVPPQHTNRARTELSEQGVAVDAVDAAKTPEQLEVEARVAELRAKQQRLIAEQADRDRALLRTFDTEAEIFVARDRKLDAINIIIQVTGNNIKRLKSQLQGLQKNAAALELKGKRVTHKLIDEIKTTRQQVQESEVYIAAKRREGEKFEAKFQADLERFRELKKQGLVATRSDADPQPKVENVISVVDCKERETCNKAWSLAQLYVRDQATTRFQLITDTLIMTAAPTRDEDISITISRIPGKDTSAQLFLDVQCKATPQGEEFCESDEVVAIRAGFKPFIETRLR